ncbi:MAG: ATP-binding protein [Deltaproteobacteria bacterium]|nr:ATP-binding protein [Deltaproteobacteria bacterium]
MNDLFLGVGPAIYGDVTQAANALMETSLVELGSEIFALPDVYQGCLTELKSAFEESRFHDARTAQKKLADLIGNTSQKKWTNIVTQFRSTGWVTSGGFLATPDRYMCAANWRRQLRIDTLDRTVKKESLPPLFLQAIRGDAVVLQMLQELADGKSECAGIAAYWLNHRDKLSDMAQADDRLSLALRAKALLEDEFNDHLERLTNGEPERAIIFSMTLTSQAISLVTDYLDIAGRQRHDNWYQESTEAGIIFHDDIRSATRGFLVPMEVADERSIFVSRKYLIHFFERRTATGLRQIVAEALSGNIFRALSTGVFLFNEMPKNFSLDFPGEARNILMRAISETIHNAIKYSDPAKQERWVRVRWDPYAQALVIEDNGIGIANVARVGEEGFREKRNEEKGTGRGIFLHRQRLAQIGWRMEVESQVGQGTTFILTPPENSPISFASTYDNPRTTWDPKKMLEDWTEANALLFSGLQSDNIDKARGGYQDLTFATLFFLLELENRIRNTTGLERTRLIAVAHQIRGMFDWVHEGDYLRFLEKTATLPTTLAEFFGIPITWTISSSHGISKQMASRSISLPGAPLSLWKLQKTDTFRRAMQWLNQNWTEANWPAIQDDIIWTAFNSFKNIRKTPVAERFHGEFLGEVPLHLFLSSDLLDNFLMHVFACWMDDKHLGNAELANTLDTAFAFLGENEDVRKIVWAKINFKRRSIWQNITEKLHQRGYSKAWTVWKIMWKDVVPT